MLLENKIINGDCLIEMNNLIEDSIHLILTDLPYGVTAQNKWDSVLSIIQLWNNWNRIKKQTSPVILFGQGMFTANLMKSNEKFWRYNLIWEKNRPTGFLNAKKMPLRSHEDILVFYEKLPTYNPQKFKGQKNHSLKQRTLANTLDYNDYSHQDNADELGDMKYPRSVLEFDRPHPQLHPTEKPIKLLEYLIKTFTNEGDTVLDCCAGSGTTSISCMNTKKNYICIEKELKYFNIMKNRITEFVDGN